MTTVVYRVWPDGQAIALFPEVPSDYLGGECMSYMRVGEHSGADYVGVVARTRKGTMENPEVARLHRLLQQIGYDDLVVRQKATYRMHRRRWDEGRRLKGRLNATLEQHG